MLPRNLRDSPPGPGCGHGVRNIFCGGLARRAGSMTKPSHLPSMNEPSAPRLTVWYDGGCPLCLREIALMRRLDRRQAIAFIDVSPPDAACPADRKLLLARFHAQEAGGELVSGAAAFAAMWRVIPILRPFGVAARSPTVLWLLERLYRGFLRVRPALQWLAGRRG